MVRNRNRRDFEESSGNVFAELGLAHASEKKTKVRLAVAINDIIAGRKLTQKDAAGVLGVSQPKVSALARYRLRGFSVERLLNFVNALDHEVEIVIRRRTRPRRTAGIRVSVA